MPPFRNENMRLISAGANFLVAFGGAAVLGRAIGVVELPFVQLGSLVAFFFGTALGLLLLVKMPSRTQSSADIYVGLCGTLSSLALLVMWKLYAVQGVVAGSAGLVFFVLLCVRFAFWFLSRILRSDRVSAMQKESIPFIEGMFHSGTIVGLIAVALGMLSEALQYILLLDIVTQAAGFALDRSSAKNSKSAVEKSVSPARAARALHWHPSLTAPALAISSVTILIQVLIFHTSQYATAQLTPAIIALFYGGLAAAGLLSHTLGFTAEYARGLGGLRFARMRLRPIGNGFVLTLSVFAFMLYCHALRAHNAVALLTCVVASSVLFEFYSLGLIDHIATLTTQHNVTRGVAKSFGCMALTSCIAMTLLRLSQLSLHMTLVCAVALYFVTIWATRMSVRGRPST